jgi:hypothetical protein
MSPLDGLKASLLPGLVLPDRPPTAPAGASTVAAAALRFEGWDARPGTASILGEARHAGNPAEHRAIAQDIVDLILEPGR